MGAEVSGIGSLFATVNKSATTTTKEEQVDGNFSSFMNLNSYHQNTFSKNYAVSQNDARHEITSGDTNVSYDKYQYKKSTVVKEAGEKAYSKEEVQAAEEKMAEFSESVTAVLKEELSVTEEEIVNAMETLNLSFVDLLNPQNLVALVGELTGCENPMQLLMTDSFQNVLTTVEEVTANLLEELGISKEEFLNICEAMMNKQTGVTTEKTADENPVNEPDANLTDETVTRNDAGEKTSTVEIVMEQQTDTKALTEKADAVAEQQKATAEKPVEAQTEEPEQTEGTEKEQVVLTENTTEEQQEDSGMASQNKDAENMLKESKTTHTEKTVTSGETNVFGAKMESVAAPNQNVTVVTQPYTDITSMVEQISKYTRILISEGGNSLEMQLNPENLGKIYIHVSEKSGAITAQISASNESVKEALQAQIVTLKENLSQQGVKVEAVEVTVESHEFEQNLEENARRDQNNAEQKEQNASGARRSINLNDLEALSGLMSEEEDLVAKMMQDNGNQMDVIA